VILRVTDVDTAGQRIESQTGRLAKARRFGRAIDETRAGCPREDKDVVVADSEYLRAISECTEDAVGGPQNLPRSRGDHNECAHIPPRSGDVTNRPIACIDDIHVTIGARRHPARLVEFRAENWSI